jgi:hypothetical protein
MMSSVVLGLGALGHPSDVRADAITQTATIPVAQTDWGTPKILNINQFDTQGGARILDQVNVSLHAHIENNFGMTFTTPSTITESVATGNPSSPGPSITIFQPDGTTPILSVQSPNDPNFLTRSVTYGFQPGQAFPQTFSSSLPSTSPFYLAPAVSDQSSTLNLTSPANLAAFSGTGSIKLPVVASAVESDFFSSGNGQDLLTTTANADVTVTYQYHLSSPQTITAPEPGSVALWGLGAAVGLGLLRRSRRR